MNNQHVSGDVLDTSDFNVNCDVDIQLENGIAPAITPEVIKFYADRAGTTKKDVDELGVEISQRQDKMRLINDLISEINNLTNDKNNLDISQHPKLQEKFRLAKELGVNIPADKMTFNAIERDRLIENLHLTASNWDKENKSQTQKMEFFIKELDRIMTLVKGVFDNERHSKRTMIGAIKGG